MPSATLISSFMDFFKGPGLTQRILQLPSLTVSVFEPPCDFRKEINLLVSWMPELLNATLTFEPLYKFSLSMVDRDSAVAGGVTEPCTSDRFRPPRFGVLVVLRIAVSTIITLR